MKIENVTRDGKLFQAVQVTKENYELVAEWCEGISCLYTESLFEPLIDLDGNKVRAYDWVLYDLSNKWYEKVSEKEFVETCRIIDHYEVLPVQPVDYIHKNSLDFFEGNVVKYVSRHKIKDGAKDIKKAIHYLEMILKYRYGE